MNLFNTDYDIKVYSKEELVSEIYVRGSSVTFKNYNYPAVMLPFGIRTSATVDDLEEFFEERCFPRERANCKDLLRRLGLGCYEPELICRKTHGLQFDDFIWLQFSDEPQVRWEDIKLRD